MELDGVLAAVPVQALRSGDNRYLTDRFAVTISAGAGAPGRATARTGRSEVAVVANPAIAGESAARFPPLADSAREVEAVRESFPGSLLEGRGATVLAVATVGATAGMVHFVGHGYTTAGGGALLLTPADPARSDYDLLRPADLRRQNWSECRLVVLSACATAAGQAEGPHNPESLVRALIRAGVPRVVASSWNVDSRATAELMRWFYRSLAAGETPGEALRTAQHEVRRRPEWQHPYYWAGFQLYGTT